MAKKEKRPCKWCGLEKSHYVHAPRHTPASAATNGHDSHIFEVDPIVEYRETVQEMTGLVERFNQLDAGRCKLAEKLPEKHKIEKQRLDASLPQGF